MAHKTSAGKPVRCSTRQTKSSNKDVYFLYSEPSGQRQDFKFPHEELPSQRSLLVHAVVAADLATLSAQGASSASADPICSSSARNLELEIRLTEVQKEKLALELEVLRLRCTDGITDVNTENSGTSAPPPLPLKRHARNEQWTGLMNLLQVTFPLFTTIN